MVTISVIYTIVAIHGLHCLCHADSIPVQIDQQQESYHCQEIAATSNAAMVGFPFAMEYSYTLKIYMYLRSQGLRERTEITCTVTETASNRVVNSTVFPIIEDPNDNPMGVAYKLHNVTTNTPLQYRVECGYPANATTEEVFDDEPPCLYYNVNLTIANIPSVEDCSGPALKSINESDLRVGSPFILDCHAPEFFSKFPEVKYRWFHQRDGECVSHVEHNSSEFHFNDVELSDAGAYTCMAYYGDHKIILVRQNICIKYQYVPHTGLSLSCDVEKVPINSNGTIACGVTVSISKSKTGHFRWFKIDSNKEIKSVCNKSYSTDHGRVSCSEESSIEEDECAPLTDTGDESPPADIRIIRLNIHKMDENDFGSYRLEYYVNGIMHGEKMYATVEINRDFGEQKTMHVAGITAGVLAIILIIGFIVLCFAMKMDILWFYKKYFGPYEKGVYPYMAYFLYHYEAEKSKGRSTKNTKMLVTNMHDFMNQFGGTVFDEHKDVPLEQCDGDNIMAVQKECHRIVLFLSPGFIEDHWSRFATYTALETMIREGKKLILITMPETRDAIKRIEDEPRRVLEMAMKMNMTIRWNGKVPFSSMFCRRLEYALPKCAKPDFNRYLSDSSQAYLTKQNGSPSKSSLMDPTRTCYKNGLENQAVFEIV